MQFWIRCSATDFVVFAPVAHHLAATGEEHEVRRPIPLLDHVQPVVDLAAQFFGVQVTAQEDRLGKYFLYDLRASNGSTAKAKMASP
jgi:hypothetical protein